MILLLFPMFIYGQEKGKEAKSYLQADLGVDISILNTSPSNRVTKKLLKNSNGTLAKLAFGRQSSKDFYTGISIAFAGHSNPIPLAVPISLDLKKKLSPNWSKHTFLGTTNIGYSIGGRDDIVAKGLNLNTGLAKEFIRENKASNLIVSLGYNYQQAMDRDIMVYTTVPNTYTVTISHIIEDVDIHSHSLTLTLGWKF